MKKRYVLLGGLLFLVASLSLQLKKRQYRSVAIDEIENVVIKQVRSKRKPASLPVKNAEPVVLTTASSFTWTNRERPKEKNEFNEVFTHEEEAFVDADVSNARITYQSESWSRSNSGDNRAPALSPSKTVSKPASNPVTNTFGNIPYRPIVTPNPSNPNNNEPEIESNPKPRDNVTPVCSSNITGGIFNGPITVNLGCSTTSTIKYCVSENICCDPETGLTYTGPIQIGQASKTFCLSFSGTSLGSGLISQTNETHFQFDPEVPDLQVVQEKDYIQTTQLNALLHLASTDFGSNHHSIGIINLKSHVPILSGLNSCQDIVEQHSSLSAPVTLNVLPETSVASYSPSYELNMSLAQPSLIYGENNITSFLKSTLYVEAKYTCTQTKLVLEDFYYFQTLPTDVITATDSSQLIGGFDYIAPIQMDPHIYRGPASDVDPTSSQQIRTGLWSIFYDK